jgi:nucleoside-diphosphate-sugar epimerase
MTAEGEISQIIVTGGRGYIGRRLVAAALAQGRRVTMLSRDAAGLPPGVRHVQWSLPEPFPAQALDPSTPPGAQALIHLAHDWRTLGPDDDLNVTGSRALRDGARAAGIGRAVFVSSQSSRADAPNHYGRIKWRIEQLHDGVGELSARVGLVYGGPRAGMYGLLCRLTSLAPILPMVAPDRTVQPIHVDEVARGLLLAADRGRSGVLGLAAAEPVTFRNFLQALARFGRGRQLFVVGVPVWAALIACRIVNLIPFLPHVDQERILGLVGTRPMDTSGDLHSLGLEVEPLTRGLGREPSSRRTLLREGRLLLRYVLRSEPGGELTRRYARAAYGLGPPLRWLFAPSCLLRFRESFGGRTSLGRRLAIATSLAEASHEGEAQLARGTRTGRLLALALDMALDVVAAPFRLLAGR